LYRQHSNLVTNMKSALPEPGKPRLRSKTPVFYSSDHNLRDLKTPVAAKNGRWSPIKIHSSKSLKLHNVII
jgi:hypothetical protein